MLRNLSRLFRILSDETRLRLLRLLAGNELTVNELATITQLAQPRISNHLKILRDEGLLAERREGPWRYYRLAHEHLPELLGSLWNDLQAAWTADDQFAADDKRLTNVLLERESRPDGAFFDQLADQWDLIRESLFGDALGRAVLRAFLPDGLVVADVGTGTGYGIELFGPRASRLIAIDHSEEMLKRARHKADANNLANVEFRLGNIESRDLLAHDEVDVISVVQVLHHLGDPQTTLRNLAAGLRPGGLLIINDFLEHSETWLRERLQHRWLGFSRRQIEEFIAASGLQLRFLDVLPGRVYTGDEGMRLRIPDGFTVTARKPSHTTA